MKKIPIIFGVKGFKLEEQEIKLFKDIPPLGYILFTRNIENADQLKKLVQTLKNLSTEGDTPILIDQEGGRVARIKPPLADLYPASKHFRNLASENLEHAYYEIFKNYHSIGKNLSRFGINVNCAPVADLFFGDAHSIIGDRSFGSSIKVVVKLCKAAIYGLLSAGIQPIIKHIPGHGRAMCDSHEELPRINEHIEKLEDTDFKVFKKLKSMPVWAMTAHILYDSLDPLACVTISKKSISYIRNSLGYNNKIIISDDVSMKALKNQVDLNALNALDAGCDIALHCNGNYEEMRIIAEKLIMHNKFINFEYSPISNITLPNDLKDLVI